MKPVFSDVVGNRPLCRRFSDDILSQKLSHAYILEGAKGSGKHMLAWRIAAALACERQHDENAPLPCMNCPSCHKIFGGNSPDVIFVNRGDKATLGVEVIRDLKRDIWIAPNDISAKIYIIEDAHTMTEQAQNALLLTLEEPPSYVLFLLLTENAASFLETIRSRAPTLRTEPIEPAEIDRCLSKNAEASLLKKNSPTEYFEIIAAADGSIGNALTLLDAKNRKPILSRRTNAKEFVRLCASRKNSAASLKFLNGLPQKRDELNAQMTAILYCLRDLLLLKQSESVPLCFFADREEAAEIAYEFTTPELLTLCKKIEETVSSLKRNANVRLTLTTLAVNTGLL